MKIIYYSDAKIPSKEANSIHIMKMCQAFANNSHEVELVAPNIKDVLNDEPYAFYGVKKNFKLTKISWPIIKGRAYIYAYSVAKYIKKRKIDFAYGRSINIAFFLALFTNVKFGIELHQPVSSKMQLFFIKKIFKSKNLKTIVVISEKLKNYYITKYNLDTNTIFVAHDGADTIDIKADDGIKLMGKKNTLQVGYVGQLYKGKGMEIISKLAKKCPKYNFHIVGGKEEDIAYWQSQTVNEKNIYYYGFVPHSKTVSYCQKFDIVLAPYSNNVYGAGSKATKENDLSNWMSPLKLFEYMSLGKLIVCSDLPVLREIIQDKKNGLICPNDNLDTWKKTLDYYYQNPTSAEAIKRQAKIDFEKKYTWQIRSKKIIDSIQN